MLMNINNPLVNINPETGIRYGVVQANSLDGGILSQIMDVGKTLWDIRVEEILATIETELDNLLSFVDMNHRAKYVEQITVAFWDMMSEVNDRYPGNNEGASYEFDIEGVSGSFDTNSNIIMIFHSPCMMKVSLCSPCYPNAGDLDTPNSDGYEAYCPPHSWFNEYDEVNRGIRKIGEEGGSNND